MQSKIFSTIFPEAVSIDCLQTKNCLTCSLICNCAILCIASTSEITGCLARIRPESSQSSSDEERNPFLKLTLKSFKLSTISTNSPRFEFVNWRYLRRASPTYKDNLYHASKMDLQPTRGYINLKTIRSHFTKKKFLLLSGK
jgi:hypothetical protein